MNKSVRNLILIAVVAAGVAAAWLWTARAKPVRVSVVTVERGEVLSTVSNTRAGTVYA